MIEANCRWALIVHGGAKEIKPEEEEDNRAGVDAAVEAGRTVLTRGGSAIEAVEAAIRVMEDLPVFNAGRGSALNALEEVEMCAGVMDGRDLSVGAVAAIRNVRNPISVARQLLPEKEVLLAGEGALMFAKEKGLPLASEEELLLEKTPEPARDTVGAVAMDSDGNLAAGTSTGGLSGARPGRVGDSPIPGSGYYASNRIGAVSLSGDGESIARVAIAAQVMATINSDSPEEAIRKALDQLPQVGGADADGGAIAISRDGKLGWWHNSSHFAVALVDSGMEAPSAWLRKDEGGRGHG